MAVLDIYIAYIVDWDRFIQVLYLGRAPRTKETLPDFLKWRRATRPPLVFRGLTGSQRTPEFWGVTVKTQVGRKSYLLELSKTRKSRVHALSSPRRTASLLAPSTTDGRISSKSREKLKLLSLKIEFDCYWT